MGEWRSLRTVSKVSLPISAGALVAQEVSRPMSAGAVAVQEVNWPISGWGCGGIGGERANQQWGCGSTGSGRWAGQHGGGRLWEAEEFGILSEDSIKPLRNLKQSSGRIRSVFH